MVLPIAYFPPIEYFALMARYPVVFDSEEQYRKQTYRNRCRILTANGVEDLRVPIVHNGRYGITEVLVDYTTDWVRRTQYAIESAYSSSPFFEYYKDALWKILDGHPQTLWDLDMRLIRFFCDKIGLSRALPEDPVCDVPNPTISPKVKSDYEAKEYWQVFRERFGFVGNLSVMDLLFNEGPESICFL